MSKNNLSKTVSQLKSFILLLFGQSVSQLGTSMTSFAILIWVYTQKGSVLTVSLLSICSLLPYLLVSLAGGAITDRVSKKAIMLICDFVAAIGSLAILLCLLTNSLEIWHLYIINAVSGLMNAFQAPASEVAVTLIVPKEHYTRVGGIKSAVSSGLGILVPVFAASILAFGGLQTVILIDLCTFVFAFITLLFVKIPKAPSERKEGLSFTEIKKDISSAFSFLKAKKGILYLIVFFGLFNFIGAISFNSLLSPMILARTGNNEIILGIVTSVMAISGLVSGLIVGVLKPAKNKTGVMFACVSFAFLIAIMLFGMGNSVIWWCITCFGSFGIPIYFAYEGAILRENIPLAMQGKIFSIRGLIMQAFMPIGYLLGGILADNVFEPFMKDTGKTQTMLSYVVGSGDGAGMGLIFVICGAIGFVACLILGNNKHIKLLNIPDTGDSIDNV